MINKAVIANDVEQRWSMFEVLNDKSAFTPNTIEEAKVLFNEYKVSGIFLNKSFEDSVWRMNDEYQRRGIYFDVNEASYRLYYEKPIGSTYEEFVDYLKTYIVFSVGELVVITMTLITNDVKKIIGMPPIDLEEVQVNIQAPTQVESFFEALPMEDDSFKEKLSMFLCGCADASYSENSINRRELCDFLSYFRFGHILDDFWKTVMPEEERLFYYPIYLWWKITGVIPTRPREFLLTPRDCLQREQGKSILTLRKNCLKGGKKKVSYNIEKDYVRVRYPISEELADEIERYISLTENCEDNELHTLFRTEPHFKKFNQPKHYTSRFYTYVNLNCALRVYYYDIVQKRYGMHVFKTKGVTDFSYDKNNIQYINLGDTRHVSMINAIAEGCSPEIVMQMAGHDSIDMSAHYYANMSSYIECRTYARYMQSLSEQTYIMGSNFYAPAQTDSYIELENNGKCYSKAMAEGKITDCVAASGDNGEIGYCPGCRFYRTGDFNYFFDDNDIYKNKIDANMDYLRKMVKLIRQGKGLNEDIKEVMLQFKSNKYDFEQYLMEKYKHDTEEKANGKTKED